PLEVDEGLEDRLRAAQGVPGRPGLFRAVDPGLPLAVVAERRALQDGGEADRRQPRLEVGGRAHRGGGRNPEARAREERVFSEAMLRRVEHGPLRPHRHDGGRGLRGRKGDVLEFESHDRDAAGERAHGLEVVVGRAHLDVGDLAGGAVAVGGEGVDPIAHPARREREHPPELAAAEDADRGPGEDTGAHVSLSWSTFRVCSSRNCRSFSRSGARARARMATARRAAFVAPALPIASVPTGTPPGICAIESSESRPFSARLSTGTPRTGSSVCAATIPGRGAAPPAPAMMTSIPRASAEEAYSAMRAGVRWAETTAHSRGTPKRARVSSAWRIVSQSERLPMITATRGFGSSLIERPPLPSPPTSRPSAARARSASGRRGRRGASRSRARPGRPRGR